MVRRSGDSTPASTSDSSSSGTASEIEIRTLSGQAIAPYLADLARLRIEVFREYPYLYDGSDDYEQHYLTTYIRSPESLFVVALDRARVVGVSTGLPMDSEEESFRQPFRERGYDPACIFYFGESVLQRAYRGRGLGVRFFAEREAHARRLGRFVWTCFCAVERPPGDPARPPGYVPLDDFWRQRGYEKHPELTTSYIWKEVGEASQSAKPMTFWLKPLEGTS